MAHDGLPQTVEAMLVMCRLPIRSNERPRKIVVLLAWLTAIDVLVELHAYGVDAVQVMEHVWSVLTVSGMALKDNTMARITYSKWYLWSEGRVAIQNQMVQPLLRS
jgi:hypothetical protein